MKINLPADESHTPRRAEAGSPCATEADRNDHQGGSGPSSRRTPAKGVAGSAVQTSGAPADAHVGSSATGGSSCRGRSIPREEAAGAGWVVRGGNAQNGASTPKVRRCRRPGRASRGYRESATTAPPPTEGSGEGRRLEAAAPCSSDVAAESGGQSVHREPKSLLRTAVSVPTAVKGAADHPEAARCNSSSLRHPGRQPATGRFIKISSSTRASAHIIPTHQALLNEALAFTRRAVRVCTDERLKLCRREGIDLQLPPQRPVSAFGRHPRTATAPRQLTMPVSDTTNSRTSVPVKVASSYALSSEPSSGGQHTERPPAYDKTLAAHLLHDPRLALRERDVPFLLLLDVPNLDLSSRLEVFLPAARPTCCALSCPSCRVRLSGQCGCTLLGARSSGSRLPLLLARPAVVVLFVIVVCGACIVRVKRDDGRCRPATLRCSATDAGLPQSSAGRLARTDVEIQCFGAAGLERVPTGGRKSRRYGRG